jgi:parvulin-like peptidyl-prolyl isomerase
LVVFCLACGCAAADRPRWISFWKRSADAPTEASRPDSAAPTTAVANPPGAVQPAGHADPANTPIGELAESIIARVDGEAILAQDVFASIRPQLAKAEAELPPGQLAQYRNTLIQRKLRDLIERQVLIQAAKKQIPEQGIKRMEQFADQEFSKQLTAQMQRAGVNTEAELRRKMLETGESLDQWREYQRGTFIAQQFLRMQLASRLDVSRQEMLDYYHTHNDAYKRDDAARWSELLVSVEKHGSSDAARTKADELVVQLRGGAAFAELAKTESQGATADEGGQWDWTTRGSYVVASVDQAVFTLPQGQISDPIEGPNGWHIVRVDERQTGGQQSFVDAQDEIRKAVREQKVQKESQRYVQDLVKKAHITTIFDREGQNKSTP